MRQILSDSLGRPLGSLESQPDGTQRLYDRNGVPLGVYDPRMNQTRDTSGRPVGSGNLLASLLR